MPFFVMFLLLVHLHHAGYKVPGWTTLFINHYKMHIILVMYIDAYNLIIFILSMCDCVQECHPQKLPHEVESLFSSQTKTQNRLYLIP